MEQFAEITTLNDTTKQVKMVTICAWCKRIKLPGQDAGKMSSWKKIESVHLAAQSEPLYISHGICPSCKSDFV